MKRRVLSLVLSLVLLVCASAGAEKVTVEFWFGETPEQYIKVMQEIVDRFNAEHDDIYVNMTLHGDIQKDKLEQLKVSVAAGVGPDLAYLDGTAILELGLGSGMFIPLNELLDQEIIDSLDFLPVPTQDFSHEGIWYGLPFRTDSRGLFINEDHFNEAGIDPRQGFADIEALDETAAKMTKRDGDGNITRLGFAPRGNNFGYEMPWISVFGGQLFDWETRRPALTQHPKNVETLDWILEYADRYGAGASASASEFLDGRVSMHINSTTRLENFRELNPDLNWWVVEIPHPAGGRKTTLSTVLGPAIPVGAAHPEAAVEFMLYLAQPETQIFWYENTQSLPTQYDAFFEILRTMDDPRERTMVELLPVAEGYPPLFAYFVGPQYFSQVDRMRRREITPAQALENVERAVWGRFEELFGE